MAASTPTPDWLRGYATDLYNWQTTTNGSQSMHWRRMGMIEGLFDVDGTDFEGRADLNMNLYIQVRTSLPVDKLRTRIVKAWSIFRQQHVLLSTSAVNISDIDPSLPEPRDRAFLFQPSPHPRALFEEGQRHLIFVDDHYPDLSPDDFYAHITNSSRAINSSSALSRLHVLPFDHSTTNSFKVHLMLIAAHQIVDGLTTFRWMNSFIDILNLSDARLNALATELVTSPPTSRLPPAQETLYPPIQGPLARRRWFWAITRILRHVKKPAPPCFPNPLYRDEPVPKGVAFPAKYPKVLNYEHTPPLNNYHINATLSPTSTSRLRQLCRDATISVGSGLFALVAITMMTLHEQRHPDIDPADRLCFIGSFPINPRPFLTGNPAPDSLMLAFSDGIALPFLPTHLPFTGRFRLLGKIAHRQLKIYQKRKSPVSPPPRDLEDTPAVAAAAAALGSQKSAALFLPSLYAMSADMLDRRRKPHARRGWDVQGAYAVKPPNSLATCGISSVGDRSGLIRKGRYDVCQPLEKQKQKQKEEEEDSKEEEAGNKDLVLDFRDIGSTVRARDGEFLVGAAGEKDWLGFAVSYDACAVDPDRARVWKEMIEGVLEPGGLGGRRDGDGKVVEGALVANRRARL